MIRVHLPHKIRIGFSQGRHFLQRMDAALPQHLHEAHEDVRGAGGVIHRAVMMVQGNPQLLRHRVQLVAVQPRQEDVGQAHRVQNARMVFHAQPLRVLPDEARVKGSVVRHYRAALTEFQERG